MRRRASALVVMAAVSIAATSSGRQAETCRGEPATIVADEGFVRGTDGDDVIVGTARNSNVEGRGGSDLICLEGRSFHEAYGEGGDDRIYGSSGGDNIYGGAGDDLVDAGPGRDLISDFEARGDDRYIGGPDVDTLRLSAEFSRGAPGGVKVDLGIGDSQGSRGRDRIDGIDSLIGTQSKDTIIGTPGANRLDGVRGGDRIFGDKGDDVIRGADRVFGEGGGSGDPPGDDFLAGGFGDDRVLGLEGDDRLTGGEGNDDLRGGPGADFADGGAGRDRCAVERTESCERS